MNKPIENDKIKRKRLKVISACGECRRKKTKCNGEYPCTGCVKAHVECKYVINQKPGAPTSIIRERLNNNVHLITQPVRKKSLSPPPPPPPSQPLSSVPLPLPPQQHIQSIEDRLSTIEDILRNMLGSSGRHKYLLDTLDSSSQLPSLYSPRVHRDIYPPLHVPAIQNGSISREKRSREEEEDDPRPQLAPIKTIHHATGTPTLRNLLNDDLPPSSAFHRLSPNNTLNESLTANNTTAPAAGDNNNM